MTQGTSLEEMGPVRAGPGKRAEVLRWVNRLGPMAGLLLVYGFFAVVGPKTFSSRNSMETMARQTVIVGMAAIGMTVVMISGGIDLSVGSVVGFSAATTAWLMRYKGFSPLEAAGGGILAAMLCGLLTGLLITRLRVVPFIITLGMMLVARGAVIGVTRGQKVDATPHWLKELTASPGIPIFWPPVVTTVQLVMGPVASLLVLAAGLIRLIRLIRAARARRPWALALNMGATALVTVLGMWAAWRAHWYLLTIPGILLTVVLAFLMWGILRYTRLGRHTFAVGSNELTARLCGVPVDRVKIIAYTLNGFFGGVAGIMTFAYVSGQVEAYAGQNLELTVIAAVVIGGGSLSGGEGSIFGMLMGALIMTVIEYGCTQMDLSKWVQQMVTGVIIVLAVTLDRLRHRMTT